MHAAIIATQATDHSTRTKTLMVGGVNIDLRSATGRPGVPIESVHVSEAGPGGVSSMEFGIEDTASLATVSDGFGVEFWNVTLARPIFTGYVSSYSYRPHEGGTGRWIDVRAVGVEALLDWLLVPNLTVPAGTTLQAAIQSCVANTEGTNPLRAFGTTGGATSQARTISTYPVWHGGIPATLNTAVTFTGQSLREAIRTCGDNASVEIALGPSVLLTVLASVDMTYGLFDTARDDYATLALSDTPAGAAAADLRYDVDAANIARGVYIAGANAAGTGTVMDGTGKPGRVAYIADSTSDSATKLAVNGAAYLAAQSSAVRGSFDLPAYQPVADTYVGSIVTVTDANIGNVTSRIMEIDKTFNPGGTEEWAVGFGGLRPSMARAHRRLTRDIRS